MIKVTFPKHFKSFFRQDALQVARGCFHKPLPCYISKLELNPSLGSLSLIDTIILNSLMKGPLCLDVS